jgi:hypothetical protein
MHLALVVSPSSCPHVKHQKPKQRKGVRNKQGTSDRDPGLARVGQMPRETIQRHPE